MARWEFATAGRILFGRGAASDAAAVVRALGRRILVVTGATRRGAWLVDGLSAAGAVCSVVGTVGEPTVAFARDGADLARRAGIDAVVAVGGGSAIDAGKAIAALAANEGDPVDYLEVVGRGAPLTVDPLPCVAIPTTAGTGSEVTRNAVLAVPGRRVKVSLRSPLMLPRVAIVDPDLTRDLPPELTAHTGLDALTQLIEPFLSPRATPLTDAICRDGIARVARALRRACADGHDMEAREDMAFASLCGGLALANAGLGAVHGLAGPVGGMVRAPHGAACAALLPNVMRANLEAMRDRDRHNPALARLAEIGQIVTGGAGASAEAAIDWVEGLIRDLRVPALSSWGLAQADIPEVVAQAARSSSMKGNPIVLTDAELLAAMALA